MRLIDADRLIELFTPYISEDKKVVYQPRLLKIDDIKNAPTIDAVPVQHGQWLNKGEHAICSECGASSGTQCNGLELIPRFSKYCQNCGARMDLDEVENG